MYILDNGKEAYVGETVDASIRAGQHWMNTDRQCLTQMSVISDDTFNKSVILDLEAFLIKHMSADRMFTLQNGNMGHQLHEYFNRRIYAKRFQEIWGQLKDRGLAKSDSVSLENSNLFKYSPYNALSSDQFDSVISIISDLGMAQLIESLRTLPKLRIGYVIPQGPLYDTIQNVFTDIPGLRKNMVKHPTDITSEERYDLLIIDEAHRQLINTG